MNRGLGCRWGGPCSRLESELLDDFIVRLLVVGAVAAVSGGVAWTVRSGVTVRRSSFSPVGLNEGIHFFSASSCESCGRARSALTSVGVNFEEHVFETERERHSDNGIDRVPAIAWVPGADSSLDPWIALGVPSLKSLVRWLGP